MIEFNPDGSIKLPTAMKNKEIEKENKLKTQRCIRIRKDIVSSYTPKSCTLLITVSDAITDQSFIKSVYGFFKKNSQVPTKLEKLNDKEFYVEIGTHFRRCSDCSALIKRYKDYLDGNLIEEKGTCTYERKIREFAYEDYFD